MVGSRTTLHLHFLCIAALFTSFANAQPVAFSDVPARVRICGDVAGWAPFTTIAPDGSGAAGLNIEVLDLVLAAHGRTAQYELLPWLRCLALAESGDMDVLLDVFDSEERRLQFLMPRPYYSLEMTAVSLRARNLGPMNTVVDYEGRRVCRIAGYTDFDRGSPINYVVTGLPPTLESAIQMLRSERCDLLLHSITILTGNAETEAGETTALLTDEFVHTPFPWMPQAHGYIGVNRKMPHAQSLHDMIDAGIAELEANGTLQQLQDKYLSSF